MVANWSENTDLATELFCFLEAIRDDNRISPIHISLFIAIVQEWNSVNCENPMCILTHRLMHLSKISGKTTYYRSLRELHEYGYIRYKPSHDGLTGTFIQLTGCKKSQVIKFNEKL